MRVSERDQERVREICCFVFSGALISEVWRFVHICNLRAISSVLALCLLDSNR